MDAAAEKSTGFMSGAINCRTKREIEKSREKERLRGGGQQSGLGEGWPALNWHDQRLVLSPAFRMLAAVF